MNVRETYDFKIVGGTYKGDGSKTLCETCKFSQIIRGHSQKQVVVHCGVSGDMFAGMERMYVNFDNRVPFPVAECNRYIDKRGMSIEQMQLLALKVDPERVRNVGFTVGLTSQSTSNKPQTS